jgi:hypothetical protein
VSCKLEELKSLSSDDVDSDGEVEEATNSATEANHALNEADLWSDSCHPILQNSTVLPGASWPSFHLAAPIVNNGMTR